MDRTQVITVISALALFFFVFDLVRRRRLREEYSWLWLAASVVYLLTAMWPAFSRWVGRTIGTSNAESAFTFLGLLFVILILIQYSVRLSMLTDQVKDLTQQVAIVDSEQQALKNNAVATDGADTAMQGTRRTNHTPHKESTGGEIERSSSHLDHGLQA